MVQSFTPNPASSLRLVREPVASQPSDRAARRDVAFENHSASGVGPPTVENDLQVIYAKHVAEAIEGGRAAILRPDARDRLLTLATRVGIRPFEAHLLIALMQDRARRGELTTPIVVSSLTPAPKRTSVGRLLAMSFLSAVGIMLALIWLITASGA